MDASISPNDYAAFGRGILRDEAGRWIKGFIISLGQLSTLNVELQVISYSIRLVKHWSFTRIEVEGDNYSAILCWMSLMVLELYNMWAWEVLN